MAEELSDRAYLALRVLVNVARNAEGAQPTTAAQLRVRALAALPPGYDDAVQEALVFWSKRESRGEQR